MLSILKKDDGYYLNIEGTKSAIIYLGERGPIVMGAIEEEYNKETKDSGVMKKLKIFDAVEEVMKMDDLQLIQARKHFKWAYLRKSLGELDKFVCDGRPSEVCPECGEPYSGACGPCSVGHCQG